MSLLSYLFEEILATACMQDVTHYSVPSYGISSYISSLVCLLDNLDSYSKKLQINKVDIGH